MFSSRIVLAALSSILVVGLSACGPDDWANIRTAADDNRPRDCPLNSDLADCNHGDAGLPDGARDASRDGSRDAPGETPDGGAGGDASRMCPPPTECQGNCNDDDGSDYERCVARGNRRGCTEEMFRSWCSRRVGEGLTWMAATREDAARDCDGTVTLERQPNGYDGWICRRRSDGCPIRRCMTPIVLSFEGSDDIATRVDDGRGSFDLARAGEPVAARTDWPHAHTPWLALDRDGDGRITSGSELFGSATSLGGSFAANGFEALAQYDSNQDGRIDAQDPIFSSLRLWFDRDGNRLSDRGEISSLVDAGILELRLQYASVARCDARGNCGVERASFVWRDGSNRPRIGTMIDVHLVARDDASSLPSGAANR